MKIVSFGGGGDRRAPHAKGGAGQILEPSTPYSVLRRWMMLLLVISLSAPVRSVATTDTQVPPAAGWAVRLTGFGADKSRVATTLFLHGTPRPDDDH